DFMREFFEQAAGGGRARRRQARSRGSDLQMELTLPFMDAVHGATRSVTVSARTKCPSCDGHGSADKAQPTVCKTCKGQGEVTMQNGFFAVTSTCPSCKGEGTTIANPCRTCTGSGAVQQSKTVEVKIPPGVDTGTTMRLAGEGDVGDLGGPPGHLYLQIKVQADPFFKRKGSDVHVNVPLSISQVALGCTITVPTVGGEVDLRIPPGTQPSDKLVMRNKGIPRVSGSGSGNQYVHVKLTVPTKLTAKQRELFTALAEEEGDAVETGGSGSFLGDTICRIRDMLHSTRGNSKASADDSSSKE
ncbi:dnaJ, partial [Symbiodinium sp. KB8]